MSLRPAAGKSKPCPPRPGAVVEAKARKPLERRKPLVQREARPASGTTFKRKAARAGTRSGHRRTHAERELSEAWKHAVGMDAGGRDQVTGEGLVAGWDAHHVIPQSTLWAMRRRLSLTESQLVELLWDRRNGMALNEATHDRHTSAMERVPRSALRDWHWGFARELDALAGIEWATAYLERTYPEAPTT